MQLALIYSMAFNLLFIALMSWLIRHIIGAGIEKVRLRNTYRWYQGEYHSAMHHLRKANKGCRRLARLIRRMRRWNEECERPHNNPIWWGPGCWEAMKNKAAVAEEPKEIARGSGR